MSWAASSRGTVIVAGRSTRSLAITMNDLASDVASAAEKAVTLSLTRLEPLDYSESSLTIVEEMLAEASMYAAQLDEDHIHALIQQFGSYILEVGRRRFGGSYLWHDQNEQPVLVVGEPSFHVAMITWDKVKGRLSGDIGDNIPFFYAGFAERVVAAKPGTRALYV